MTEQSSHYSTKYGAWAGYPSGHAPDLTRCCEKVFGSLGSPGGKQCSKPRGHGPDGAYCKQHDPAAVKARQVASSAKYDAQMNEARYGWNGRKFYAALVKIAEGHNDARGLAQEVVDEFKKGER
jgi:hypothetical protein